MSEARAARIAGLSLTGLWLAVSVLAAIAAGADAEGPATVAALERSEVTADLVTVSE